MKIHHGKYIYFSLLLFYCIENTIWETVDNAFSCINREAGIRLRELDNSHYCNMNLKGKFPAIGLTEYPHSMRLPDEVLFLHRGEKNSSLR